MQSWSISFNMDSLRSFFKLISAIRLKVWGTERNVYRRWEAEKEWSCLISRCYAYLDSRGFSKRNVTSCYICVTFEGLFDWRLIHKCYMGVNLGLQMEDAERWGSDCIASFLLPLLKILYAFLYYIIIIWYICSKLTIRIWQRLYMCIYCTE